MGPEKVKSKKEKGLEYVVPVRGNSWKATAGRTRLPKEAMVPKVFKSEAKSRNSLNNIQVKRMIPS